MKFIRDLGKAVYDYRAPAPGETGFHWRDIDPDWQSWSAEDFIEGLRHPLAVHGFALDYDAMSMCEACVMVMPSGLSAHLEVGWFCGAGRPTAILLDDGRPELMYKMAKLCTTLDALREWVNNI